MKPIEAGLKAWNKCLDDDGDDKCAFKCGVKAAVEGLGDEAIDKLFGGVCLQCGNVLQDAQSKRAELLRQLGVSDD